MIQPALRRAALLLALLAGSGVHAPIQAQDVEMLGRRYGTRPPQGYYDLMERDPGAFQFKRAWIRRGLRIPNVPGGGRRGEAFLAPGNQAYAQLLAQAAEKAPVTGTFHFPLILGLFADSPPVPAYVQREAVQAEFFDGPQANPAAVGTIPQFYDEMSGARVTLTGTTFDWQETALTRFQVTAGVSGLGSGSRVGEYIVMILEGLDNGSVDWGLFDNDGPDGVPNSGDDDGYVDVLAVMHPTPGGECSSGDRPNRIWSHRWTLDDNAFYYGSAWDQVVNQAIRQNGGYVTKTPSAQDSVPFIKINDYVVQPVLACAGNTINYIGVFAHELGHGFGLPDLYPTGSQDHEGIGIWGLMGTGAWGCDDDSEWSPCHMSAWSKEVLGWADLEVLDRDLDLGVLSLPPVEATGKVYRIDSGDDSGEYLLLENRQRSGFDQNLFAPGLLIWHIDPVTIQERQAQGQGINNVADRMGVWLRQADGLDELAAPTGDRGDGGDPFPGLTGNTVFHAGSNPSSWTHDGEAMGVTLLDIGQAGENMTFRALTRYQTVTLQTEGSPSGAGLVSVDGASPGTAEWAFASAPFQSHVIEAAPGEVMAEGIRRPFQGWADGGPRIREFTTGLEDVTFTATYEGLEYLLSVEMVSPAEGVQPGDLQFDAGDGTGWVPDGEDVSVEVTPRTGFEFLEWTGALAGQGNPASVTMTAPTDAGAVFGVTFSAESNPPSAELAGGVYHALSLVVENANYPVTWTRLSGSLPPNMNLTQSGNINGVPLARGDYPMTLRVVDAIGLQAFLPLTLIVEDPQIPAETLTSPFLLTGPVLDGFSRDYLDHEGNANDVYDLGDFRAYVLRNPELGGFRAMESLIEIQIPMGDLKRLDSGGGRSRPDGKEGNR